MSSGNAKASLKLRQSRGRGEKNVQKGIISETEVALKRTVVWLGSHLQRLIGKYSFDAKEWKPKERKLRMGLQTANADSTQGLDNRQESLKRGQEWRI